MPSNRRAAAAKGRSPGGGADRGRRSAKIPPGFGEFSLDFTLICHVKSFNDQFLVQHELRKRILRRLGAEGIRIPVQVRGTELRSAGGDGPARS